GVGGRDPGGGPAVTEVPPVRDDLLIIRRRGGVDVEAGPVERRGEVRNRRRGDGHFLRHATGRAVVVGHRQRDLVDAWLLVGVRRLDTGGAPAVTEVPLVRRHGPVGVARSRTVDTHAEPVGLVLEGRDRRDVRRLVAGGGRVVGSHGGGVERGLVDGHLVDGTGEVAARRSRGPSTHRVPADAPVPD